MSINNTSLVAQVARSCGAIMSERLDEPIDILNLTMGLYASSLCSFMLDMEDGKKSGFVKENLIILTKCMEAMMEGEEKEK